MVKKHTVHTKHPRYKVPNYPRGQGGGDRHRTLAQRGGLMSVPNEPESISYNDGDYVDDVTSNIMIDGHTYKYVIGYRSKDKAESSARGVSRVANAKVKVIPTSDGFWGVWKRVGTARVVYPK